jgi:hypothetical protein
MSKSNPPYDDDRPCAWPTGGGGHWRLRAFRAIYFESIARETGPFVIFYAGIWVCLYNPAATPNDK